MSPPRVFRRLLERLAPENIRPAYLDDLDELFAREAARRGSRRAGLWYATQALAAVPRMLAMRRRMQRRTRPRTEMTMVDSSIRNLRHGARLLAQAPGFAAAAVATLALGIGANAAIFSLVQAVMLEEWPYRDSHDLVLVLTAAERTEPTHLSLREILGYREVSSFEQLATYMETNANLTGGDDPERVRAAAVSANLFETLGVRASIGRTFASGEDGPDAPPVVLLGHGLWERRFGGDASVIGRTIPVNGRPRTIVGVMPPSFRLPVDYRADRPSELWVPLVIDPANLEHWGSRSYLGVARLARGSSPAAATGEIEAITAGWIRAGFIRDSGDGAFTRSAVPIDEFIVGSVRRPLLILLGAVGLVLLVACANVVNLLLARADARRREIAVRTALGATRGSLVGQLLTETLLLAGLGGLAGLAIAWFGLRALAVFGAVGLPRVEAASLDPLVVAFTVGLSLVTGIAFGLVPAIQLARSPVAAVLNEAGRSGRGRPRLFVRRGLVVAQLSLSVVLVIGAGLLLRSLIALNRIDLGFDPANVLTAQLQLPAADYPDEARVTGFYRELVDRLDAVPRVTAAGGARILPLARSIGDWSITIEGRPLASPNENPNGDFQAVTPGYFEAMRTRLVRGRFITAADREDAPLVAVINDTMAARYWPGLDAIGRRFQMGGTGTTRPPMTIVGIVKTSRHNAMVEAPRAEMFLPHAQLPQSLGSPGRSLAIVLRTEGDPLAAVTPLRDTVRSIDPNLPLADIQTMEAVTGKALAGARFAAWLLGVFAALALTLAAIGTYATVSLLVSERAHEIGIRMALGAGRREILAWVLGEGLVLASVGLTVGVAGAVLLSRVLETLLYGVTALDPLTFALVPAVLAAIALAATWTPARRAAGVDPATALRRGT